MSGMPRGRTVTPSNQGRSGDNRRMWIILGLIMVCLVTAVTYVISSWRAGDTIVDTYGARSGLAGSRSVNGTAVLGRLYEQEGASVTSWQRLSPRLRNADTIVWVPNSYSSPTPSHCAWFEEWLADGYDRTLVYVGRDYDAEVAYWDAVKPLAPAEQATEVARRQAIAKMDNAAARSRLAPEDEGTWFTIHRDKPPRPVTILEGPWSDYVDPTAAEITLGERYEPPPPSVNYYSKDVEVLLSVPRKGWMWPDSEPLVTRITSDDWSSECQIIVVTNGSFLLNYALVNHEHRALAQLLVEECADVDDTVFLESGPSGPAILDRDPERKPPSALEMLTIWPVRAVTIHVAAMAIIICFAMYPVFGRPVRFITESRSDFENHIHALGSLMAKTQNFSYARERIKHYHERVRRDSGASHSKPREQAPSPFTPSLAAMAGGASATPAENSPPAAVNPYIVPAAIKPDVATPNANAPQAETAPQVETASQAETGSQAETTSPDQNEPPDSESPPPAET